MRALKESKHSAKDFNNQARPVWAVAPWPRSFSYSRAPQAAALKAWSGNAANWTTAQAAFHHRAKMNSRASQGKCSAELERQAA